MDPRFTTQSIGRYTAEYDHEGQELRLCWSGLQTFLNQDETAALLQYLQSVLKPVEEEKPDPLICEWCGSETPWSEIPVGLIIVPPLFLCAECRKKDNATLAAEDVYPFMPDGASTRISEHFQGMMDTLLPDADV